MFPHGELRALRGYGRCDDGIGHDRAETTRIRVVSRAEPRDDAVHGTQARRELARQGTGREQRLESEVVEAERVVDDTAAVEEPRDPERAHECERPCTA